jgi:hypothetical protein
MVNWRLCTITGHGRVNRASCPFLQGGYNDPEERGVLRESDKQHEQDRLNAEKAAQQVTGSW